MIENKPEDEMPETEPVEVPIKPDSGGNTMSSAEVRATRWGYKP